MKRIFFILLAIVLGVSGYFYFAGDWQNVMRYVENGQLTTFEARFTPEAILEANRKQLLPDAQHSFRESVTYYYPHLLIDAKYTQSDKKTYEGPILWSQYDGELVLNTDTWEQTHGFADAMNANASRTDFKVLHALSKYNGSCTLDQLYTMLHGEEDTLAPWVENAIKKHLVVQIGRDVQLHFQNPKIPENPKTKIRQSFVSKDYQYNQCLSRKYSRSQIERTTQAAFGPTFTIRNISEVYLPVYGIAIANPDGSVLVSLWNAITGKRLDNQLSD